MCVCLHIYLCIYFHIAHLLFPDSNIALHPNDSQCEFFILFIENPSDIRSDSDQSSEETMMRSNRKMETLKTHFSSFSLLT